MARQENNKDNASWRRRVSKRIGDIHAAKATREYQTIHARPLTPDPSDRSISDRCWKQRLRGFRQALRDTTPQNLPALPDECLSAATFAPSSLIGRWGDHQGSIYQVMSGRKGWLHVTKTWISGESRFTQNLIRTIRAQGRDFAVWGKCRYELQRAGPEEIRWRGPSQNDVFVWRRLEN